MFAENTIKIGGFSKKKEKHTKKTKNLVLKTGPSMLRNKSGPGFNARNVVLFFVSFSSFFFEKSSSFCRENEIKKKTKKNNTRKGKNWTSFELYSIYIYMAYIYICEQGLQGKEDQD